MDKRSPFLEIRSNQKTIPNQPSTLISTLDLYPQTVTVSTRIPYLAGGFNPLEKYARQIAGETKK